MLGAGPPALCWRAPRTWVLLPVLVRFGVSERVVLVVDGGGLVALVILLRQEVALTLDVRVIGGVDRVGRVALLPPTIFVGRLRRLQGSTRPPLVAGGARAARPVLAVEASTLPHHWCITLSVDGSPAA